MAGEETPVAPRSVVEVTTFLTVLRRWVDAPWVHLAFKASWLLIRVLWFSYLPFHCAPRRPPPRPPSRPCEPALAAMLPRTACPAHPFAWAVAVAFFVREPWPVGLRGRISRGVILVAVSGFAVLQLVWTQQGLAAGKGGSESPGEEADV